MKLHLRSGTNGAAHHVLSMALLAAALVVTAAPARAEPVSQPTGWGLGLMLGAPTGLTVKRWIGGANAWDVGVGVGPGFRLHGDFLWGLAELLPNKSDLTLDIYLGIGPVIGVARGWCGTTYRPRDECGGGDGELFGGARVPLGLDARLARLPINFGLEVAPGVWLGRDFATGLLDVFLFVRFLF
jgi:hypothetical protein